ncbi:MULTISPECIES: response regulator transcription factor [Pelosinus]|uniref:Response regulator receiver n=1 Tax=Pelosinus fermentans B4 TaxID=1149862 RepID=I8RJK2_9FIRM|nr:MULTISPECIES: response regulator transcription factor [Pelosinus]EIW20223.1 response regulator receiver [Pelosinus fermentans B4]EIW25939.1 two component transcriptional regulator, winged helix family [Pelosinus fermentans A11]OAM93237.1 two component transcriptional regulator, winged helix family [Pelosinus fermentans DSM 17108]SDQ71268.1 DNA-binding response regulator, OmpR family, contains REC and winged-helix (wHTH) domain [Pelosinus fermentans]
MRILVVEDDQMLREVVVAVLKEEEYLIHETGNGEEGLYLALQNVHDLLILDIMLPEVSGLEIVKTLRLQNISMPIMLLTAKDSVQDRVIGLNSGADDYLVKPFAIPELLARVKALLRRTGMGGKEGELLYGDISVNFKLRDGFVDKNALQLTSKEYDLLEYLILNQGHILTREQIFDRIWGFESETTIGIVDLYIHYLRKKLTAQGSQIVIQTIRGAGFMMKEK